MLQPRQEVGGAIRGVRRGGARRRERVVNGVLLSHGSIIQRSQ